MANPNLDVVYVVNAASTGPISTYSLNPTTGALTAASTISLAGGSDPVCFTTDLAGAYGYVTCFGNAKVAQFSLNAATGIPTTLNVQTVGTGTNTTPLAMVVVGTIQ